MSPPLGAANPRLAEAADAIEQAAAGAAGLVLDLSPRAPAYAYAWPGRSPSIPPGDMARYAAQAGRSLASAAYAVSPSCELAILTHDPLRASELWRGMLTGLLQGLAASERGRMTWLAGFGTGQMPPGSLSAYGERLDAAVKLWAPAACEVWRKRGGVGFRLAEGAALHEPAAWAARLASRRIAWADAPLEDAEGERSSALPDVASFQRAGPTTFAGQEGYALLGAEGAAVVVWRPQAASAPMERLGPASRVLPFDGAEPYALTPERPRLPPGDVPALIAPLPTRHWGGPQCLWLEILEPATAAGGVPVSFGFSNRLSLRFEGALAARLPATLEMNPLPLRLSLAPGETYAAQAALRGPLELGETVAAQLTAVSEGGVIASEAARIPVQPSLAWSLTADAPWTALRPAPLGGEAAYAALSASGRVTLLDAQGQALWTRHKRETFETPPAVFRDWSGDTLLAAATHRGNVYAWDAMGKARWSHRVRAPLSPSGLITADLHPFPGQEVLAPLTFGGVTALLSNGRILWERPLDDLIAGAVALAPPDQPRQDAYIAAAGDAPALLRLGEGGRQVFRTPLEAEPLTPPVVATIPGEANLTLALGLESGRIAFVNGGTGEALPSMALPEASPVKALTAYRYGGEARYLAATEAGLFCLEGGGATAWVLRAPCSLTPAIASDGILAALDDGATACLSHEGELLWVDERPILPQPASPLITGAEGAAAVVTVSLDGAIRCVRLKTPGP